MTKPDIEGMVEFLPEKSGGRKAPMYSGYRPQVYCLGDDRDASLYFPEVEKVFPGDTVNVVIEFRRRERLEGLLNEGMCFLIREGGRTIGFGKVDKVRNKILRTNQLAHEG